ncbi:protein phosphatase 2C family protein [Artemisia annua]|uniref:Protein phosphatase 2C family protein n=1 Tax=Artemisia annua TaxID=35608 RepID=A0A2U1NPS3_ARTAN|nr:protein phosphatase 2C family protein [Artemisia annua]
MRKGEDYFMMKTDCQRVSRFSRYVVFDGHIGNAAALYSRDNLLNHILSAIPRGLGRDEWLQALPRALVAAFVKTDKEFQSKGQTSGTTATFVIVDRWIVTVASVGDSRCILDAQGGAVSELTVDHRLEENQEDAILRGLGRDEWLQALPRALVAAFVKTDKEFQSKGQTSGTTATFVIVDRWIVTVASVGDSQCILDAQGGTVSELTVDHRLEENQEECILDAQGGAVSELTVDHRLEENQEERERVKASGGEVGRLRILGGAELSDVGGRLIIASDGIWDDISDGCKILSWGLKDDTTCIVVDIIPPDSAMPPPSTPRKKQSKFSLRSLFFRKSSNGSASKLFKKLSAVGIVEELSEEGFAMLSKRRERVKASGGEVGRQRILGGAEIGPLRCWPGGLCLSRSIGDMDVGEFIVPIPYVKQVKLSDVGGRLIIASDGIWDGISDGCKILSWGLKDDTTCIVVDIIPPDSAMPPPSTPRKKQSKFSLRSLFFRKSSNGSASKLFKKLSAVGIVEELSEEGFAMLSKRCAKSAMNAFSSSLLQIL